MKINTDAFEHELNAAAAEMQAKFFRAGAQIKERQARHHKSLARRHALHRTPIAAARPGHHAGK